MRKICLTIALLPGLFLMLRGQVASISPSDFGLNDTITLTFNALAGNGALAGISEPVYFHTGVITPQSEGHGDWKHVVGRWGEEDPQVRMTPLGDDLYGATMVPGDFYDVADIHEFLQLAFVFRNASATRIAKGEDEQDILIPVNGYIEPEVKTVAYNYSSRKLISFRSTDQGVAFTTDHGTVKVNAFSKAIVEVSNVKDDTAVSVPTVAVRSASQHIPMGIAETSSWVVLTTDSLQVLAHRDPFYLTFVVDGDTVFSEERGYFERDSQTGLRFNMQPEEQYWGLGERAVGLNLAGGQYPLYNKPHYGYELGAVDLNYSVPLVVSSNRYLFLFDNPQKGIVDLGFTDPGIMEWSAVGGDMRYFFIAGSDFKSISRSYGWLTGTQPLPPLWALGNLQSRMAYRNQQETDSIVTLMQQKDFPIDAIILDFYWFGDSIKGTMGRLDWYKPAWPDPDAMISDFRLRGVKTILITEPYIIDSLQNFNVTSDARLLATNAEGDTYVNPYFYFGPAGLIDIFKPEAREWFWQQYQKQMERGVAGWWGDLGEPESHPSDQMHILGPADAVHNIYGHYWHQMIWDNYRKNYPQRRLFNLNRAGFAGSQRYGIYPWTGDVARSWGGYEAQVPLMIHMSMSGLPFIHSDAGGFAIGERDDQLYTRWLQMAAFSPILRPHGSYMPSEPVYFDTTTQRIVRKFMKLRYSLIPYIYTAAWESHVYGYPIVRPLFWSFPGDTAAYSVTDEYMFGDDLLVAPILTAAQETRKVYLPANSLWYDLWNAKAVKGGQQIAVPVSIERMPVYVKGGSFIPRVKPVNSTDEICIQHLEIDYYPGNGDPADTGWVYLDDGETFGAWENGDYTLLRLTAAEGKKGLTFTLEAVGNGYLHEPDFYQIDLQIKGRPMEDIKVSRLKADKRGREKMTNFEEAEVISEDGQLSVSFPWAKDNATIIIQ